MARKRPCMICRQWFMPHPRAGKRQKACGKPACQRERHRRACADWRRRNPGYDAEERVRRRVRAEPGAEVPEPPVSSMLERIPGLRWDAVRDAVGLEAGVIIEESGKVIAEWVRDAVRSQALVLQGESSRPHPCPLRDGIDCTIWPP